MEFTRPSMLVGLLVLPWIALWWYRGLTSLSGWQRVALLVVRSLIAISLVLALAGLSVLATTRQQFIVVAIDRSQSIDQAGREFGRQFLRDLVAQRGDERIAVMTFRDSPDSPQEITSVADLDQFLARDAEANLDSTGTDLQAAIQSSAAYVDPLYVPHLVMVTDGHQTQGDALAASIISRVPVSTVAVPDRTDSEIQLSALRVPAKTKQGEPFVLEVVIDSTVDTTARLRLYRESIEVDLEDAAELKLVVGENRFRFPQRLDDGGRLLYRAEIESTDDTVADNNAAAAYVVVQGPARMLLVGSQPETTDSLRWALTEQNVQVEIRPPPGLPEELIDFQPYDAIVLSNVAATELSSRQMLALQSYVRDLGGGLIVLGGDQAFGLGGYFRSPLENLMPVRSDFEKEQEKPSLAMILIIDRSGSMTGEKLELAKDAARAAVELLGPRDQIGVIAFDEETYWASELHSAADRNYLFDRIATISPGGGTNLYAPLVEASSALQRAVAKLKHVILLSDGISSSGDFDTILAEMSSRQLTVSTIAFGEGADEELLQRIARQGNGRYYFCDDPQTVPQLFVKETMMASQSAINELPFLPVEVRKAEAMRGVDLATAPLLLGFVTTRPKATGEIVLATETGEPLLAWWRYGLGISVAFTSDASTRWAAEWLTWPEFGKFWAQWIRFASRPVSLEGVDLSIRQIDQQAEVQVEWVDQEGRFVNGDALTMTVIPPAGIDARSTSTLQLSAPGLYRGTFPTTDRGAYLLDVASADGAIRESRGWYVGYPDELRLNRQANDLLSEIADLSGGMVQPTASDVLQHAPDTVPRVVPWWKGLVAFALVLLVLDVALRRIG